jgi:hypothetical protein
MRLPALFGWLRGSKRERPPDDGFQSPHDRETSGGLADTAGGDAQLAGLDALSRIGPLGEPPADLDAEFKPPPDY